MKRSTRIVKKLLALFLIVLMSINSFGAVVGDNDGSAFITKAEFDSLKNDFQSQIDQYNTSIDSKIDGAIASYLAGISLSHTQKFDLPYGTGLFWIYANGRPALPHTTSDWYYNNNPARTAATQRLLGLSTHTVFETDQVGAPPIWIVSDASDDATISEYGGFTDEVNINMVGRLDGSNYLNFPSTLNTGSGVYIAAYLQGKSTDALTLTSYDYIHNPPSDWGVIQMKLCQFATDAVDVDSAPTLKLTSSVTIGGVVTPRIDQNNAADLSRTSIEKYIDNIVYSETKYVPLAKNANQILYVIDSHALNPILYHGNTTGWFQYIEPVQTSGSHKVYLYYPDPRDMSAVPNQANQVLTGDRFFFGRGHLYSDLQYRSTATDAYGFWITSNQEQVFILPNSGRLQADYLYQKIKDHQNEKLKSYAGIKLTDKAEGDISFELKLQAYGYTNFTANLIKDTTSYKIAAGTKPFTNGTTNTNYVKINDSTTDVVSLSANGTYKISIKDVKGEPVYFKIVPDNDRDVEVTITDCQYDITD